MFMTKDTLKAVVKEMVGDVGEVPKLKREIAELQLKKEMEERDIKHLVTLKQEKLDIEHKKKELALQEKYKQKEMELQTSYHDKIMAQIETARKEMREVYTKIMERLPNVNMEIKKGK